MLEREAAPGIHRIEDAHTNWYLVEEDGELTVLRGHGPVWRDGTESIVEGARRRGPS